MALRPRDDLVAPRLVDLVTLDDAAFRAFFSGSPVKRITRDRFIRNTLIALGNSGDVSVLPQVIEKLSDPAAIVRAMAVWAWAELDPKAARAAAATALASEPDEDVCNEWKVLI